MREVESRVQKLKDLADLKEQGVKLVVSNYEDSAALDQAMRACLWVT